MTRKSPTDKKDSDRASKVDVMDYTKLKSLLEGFVAGGCRRYNEELDDVLRDTARSGTVRMPWNLFKPLLHYKIEKILGMDVFQATPPPPPTGAAEAREDMSKQLLQLLNNFQQPPFTVQRLCELVIEPCRHYRRRDRFMRALEKNLMVVSTHDPDLTWMRIPTLAHLLESKPSTPSDKVSSPPVCDVLDKQPAINKKLDDILLPHTGSFTFDKLPTLPGTSPDRPHSPRVRERREGTPPPLPVVAGLKRSSSLREIGHDKDSEMVQLQEADSTVADPTPAQDELGGAAPALVVGRKVWEQDKVFYSKQRVGRLGPELVDEDADVLKALMGPVQVVQSLPDNKVCNPSSAVSLKCATDKNSDSDGSKSKTMLYSSEEKKDVEMGEVETQQMTDVCVQQANTCQQVHHSTTHDTEESMDTE